MYSPTVLRLLSLLFAAAVIPLLALYGLLMYVSTPTPEGGMEPTVTMVCYFAFTIIFLALIIVSLNFSRQLSREAKGLRTTP
jgi:hypothetical protein